MIKILKSKFFKDKRGELFVIEPKIAGIPFTIKRIFFIKNVPDYKIVRAKHAHHKVQEALFAVAGSCTILTDDGKRKRQIKLDHPQKGLYLGPNIWREITGFSKDCVLAVLAHDKFDPKDFISDYDDFLKKYK